MHPYRILTLFITVITGLFSVSAFAQVSFSGSLNTVSPEVSIESMSTPVAHVKQFHIELQKDAVECDLKTESWAAQNTYMAGAKPLCLFEWTGTVNGLSVDDLFLKGVLDTAGQVSFEYQVSILNGGNKTVLLTDTYTIDVTSPEVPEILGAIVKWSDGDVSGLTQENYGRARRVRGVEVQVAARPFEQRVDLMGRQCEVGSNETSCYVALETFVPGEGIAEAIGSVVEAIEVVDTLDYLDTSLETVVIDYDYRSPEIVDFVTNGLGQMSPIPYNVDGTEFMVEANEALLLMSTPHADKQGDWWLPDVRDIRLRFTSENGSTREMEINGQMISFPVGGAVPEALYRIFKKGEVQRVNEFTVIKYDIGSLPDGDYDAVITATDSYDNTRSLDMEENLIDRNGPAIVGLIGSSLLRPGSEAEAYFLDDIYFAAHGGWDDGTTLTAVEIDGQSADITRVNDKVVRLNDSDALSANERLTYVISAEDGNGNVTTQEYKFQYNPAEFRLVDAPSEVYEYIHEMDIDFYQVGGVRCRVAASAELAQVISTDMQKGCTVNFPDLPDGLAVTNRGASFNITGALGGQGVYDLDYEVKYHHQNGDEKVVYSGTQSIVAKETPELSIAMSDLNIISDGLYSVPHDARKITRSFFNRVNGKVDLTMSTDTEETVKQFRASKRRGVLRESNFIERLGDGESDLWSRRTYTMDVAYSRIPGSNVSQSFDVVVTPDSKTRAYLNITLGGMGTTADDAEVRINVGRYNRREDAYDYTVDSMGEWTAALALDSRSGLTVISDEYDTDINGEINFTMSAEELFDYGDKFVAIVKSKSAVPGFEREIKSSPQRVKVLKAGGIDGQIEDELVSDEVPFNTILRYRYDTNEDREVAGDINWQTSSDGVNWTDITNETDMRLYVRTTNPGEQFYRFKTVNRLSDVISYSNVARVVGYELMDFEIQGPRKLLRDQVAEFSVNETSTLVGAPDGVYEYSDDAGLTWTEFMSSFEYSAPDDFVLLVRNRLDSTAVGVGDESYTTVRHTARVEEPKRLRVDLKNVRYAEANFPVQLEGKATIANSGVVADIMSELVLPDGTVIESSQHEYTILEEDIVDGKTEFVYRAWIDGYKSETLSQDLIAIPTKTYEFPQGDFFVSSYYALAPSEIDAEIRRIDTDVNGVEFTYEWSIDENVFDIASQKEDKVDLVATESGIHTLAVTVRDNRGNEKTYSQLITIETAPPMVLEYKEDVSKDNFRAPLNIKATVRATPGHRRDSVQSYEYYINDVKQDVSTRSRYASLPIEEQGTYDIKVVVTSEFGQVGEHTAQYTVLPNIPPECSPSIRMRDENRYVAHNCVDSDGELAFVTYEWGTTTKLNVIREEYFSNLSHPSETVRITAVDDGGEQVSYTISW